MTKSNTDIPILDDDAIAEIEAMFPHAEYQPTLSPDEVDPCEFCKGTIDDHKANCVVPHVRALCKTVRSERERADSNYAAYDRVKGLYSETVNQLKQVTKERDDWKRTAEMYSDQLEKAQ